MKLQQRNSGEWEAVLKTGRRGKLKTVRLHVTEKPQAEKLVVDLDLERVERMSVAGTISRDLVRKITHSERVMVGTAIDRWYAWLKSTKESDNTSGRYHGYALVWMRDSRARNHDIGEIGEDDIDRWVNQPDGRKANTRRFRLAVMRSLFWFSKEKNYRDDDPSQFVVVKMKDLSHEQKEVRIKRLFTDEEFAKLDAYMRAEVEHDYHWRYAFWLPASHIARNSALRLGDIASLQWASIGDKFIVWTDKRNTRVELEITPELRAALNLIPKRRNSIWCFPREAAIVNVSRYRSTLSVDFSRVLKKAGIENHTFHELRSKKISELIKEGKTIEFAAKFAGHKNTSTTEGYILKS